jgi:hypothetical protein
MASTHKIPLSLASAWFFNETRLHILHDVCDSKHGSGILTILMSTTHYANPIAIKLIAVADRVEDSSVEFVHTHTAAPELRY